MSACTPVYLDESVLVMRAQVQDVLFIFEKV